MVLCGATGGYATDNDCRYIWTYEITIIGSNSWSMEDQVEILRMAADGEIVPVIDCILPMKDAGPGIQKVMDRDFFGKIVLTP